INAYDGYNLKLFHSFVFTAGVAMMILMKISGYSLTTTAYSPKIFIEIIIFKLYVNQSMSQTIECCLFFL
ncbi:hypothetical protein L9F63_008735, partial [Diploptera punctata]